MARLVMIVFGAAWIAFGVFISLYTLSLPRSARVPEFLDLPATWDQALALGIFLLFFLAPGILLIRAGSHRGHD